MCLSSRRSLKKSDDGAAQLPEYMCRTCRRKFYVTVVLVQNMFASNEQEQRRGDKVRLTIVIQRKAVESQTVPSRAGPAPASGPGAQPGMPFNLLNACKCLAGSWSVNIPRIF
jgi:hypothetical protein